MKPARQVIAEVLFCDFGIGENTEPGSDANKSDLIAKAIVEALQSEGYPLNYHDDAA